MLPFTVESVIVPCPSPILPRKDLGVLTELLRDKFARLISPLVTEAKNSAEVVFGMVSKIWPLTVLILQVPCGGSASLAFNCPFTDENVSAAKKLVLATLSSDSMTRTSQAVKTIKAQQN